MEQIKDKNIALVSNSEVLWPFVTEDIDMIPPLVVNLNEELGTELSTDTKDYVILSVPIFELGKPNANGLSYSVDLDETSSSVLSIVGVPVILDHNVNDATVIGVVASVAVEDKNVYTLLAIDFSNKDNEKVLKRILDIDEAEFSLSSYNNIIRCSECKQPVVFDYDEITCCEHLRGKIKFDKDGYIYCINTNVGANLEKWDFTAIEVSLVDHAAEKVSKTKDGFAL